MLHNGTLLSEGRLHRQLSGCLPVAQGDSLLSDMENKLLTMLMDALLLLFLAAIPDRVVHPPRPVMRVATATVLIIQAERIEPALPPRETQKPDRQIRQREARPLVEFY